MLKNINFSFRFKFFLGGEEIWSPSIGLCDEIKHPQTVTNTEIHTTMHVFRLVKERWQKDFFPYFLRTQYSTLEIQDILVSGLIRMAG